MTQLTERERRWLDALLIIGTLLVATLLVGQVSNWLFYFSDILLIFFLAWLLAFVINPVASFIVHTIPGLPRAGAVVLTYALLLVVLTGIALFVAGNLATSTQAFLASVPQLQQNLPAIVKPWQDWLASIGLQVDLATAAQQVLASVGSVGASLVGPLTNLAVASLGLFGNLVIVLFLSLYLAIDGEQTMAFINRLVPPRYAEEFALLEVSVSRSFGGFLRGQALIGLVYGLVAAGTSLLLGLDFAPLTAFSSGILQAIPFFGPFISWAPPVAVALLTKPDALLPTLALMVAGWFVVMNVIQPRVMGEAVGIHPAVVLGSVIVGAKIAGVAGAIFSVPVAAVLSSVFFYYLNHLASGSRDVTSRAARAVAAREGHPVRVPRPPEPAATATEGTATGRLRPRAKLPPS